MSKNLDNVKAGLLIAGAAAAVYFGYKAYQASKSLVTETLNPASDKNIVNQGVTSVVQSVTGDPNATLGNKIYDWLHPGESASIRQVTAMPAAADTAKSPNSFSSFLDKLKQSTFQW